MICSIPLSFFVAPIALLVACGVSVHTPSTSTFSARTESLSDGAEADPFAKPQSLAPENWWVLGPFPLDLTPQGARVGIERDFLAPLGGEAHVALGADTKMEWRGQNLRTRRAQADVLSVTDLAAVFSGDTDERLAYAYGVINSADAKVVEARFGSDDQAQVWLNGALVYRVTLDRGVDPDAYSFEMKLVAGENRLLVKVDNGRGNWGFALRVFDQRGLQQLSRRQHRQNLDPLMPRAANDSHLLGESFPELRPRNTAARLVFGDAQPRVRWFGPDYAAVTRPGPAGNYMALVEMRSLEGDVHRRSLGFARVPHPELAGDVQSVLGGPDTPRTRAQLMALAQEKGPDQTSTLLEAQLIHHAEHELLQRMAIERRTPRPLAPPTPAADAAPPLRVGNEREADVPAGSSGTIRKLALEWAKEDLNGFVVLVARKGVVFFHEGFNGFSSETKFNPASIGKTIGSLLFARAVDQGLLDLDQRVGDVLPDWAEGNRTEITFRNLFNHAAGLRGHASHGGLSNTYLDNALALQDVKFSVPRKRFFYSGDGGNIAAKALELTTGTSIFRLLYDNLQQPFDPSVRQVDMGVGDAFSAVYLARLGQMILQDGAYDGKRFYSPNFLKTLLPRRISDSVPGFEGDEEWGIGFEWMVDPDGPRSKGVLGPDVIGHHSASGCVLRIAPDQQLIVVVGRSQFAGAWGDNERRIDRFVVGVAKALELAAGHQ